MSELQRFAKVPQLKTWTIILPQRAPISARCTIVDETKISSSIVFLSVINLPIPTHSGRLCMLFTHTRALLITTLLAGLSSATLAQAGGTQSQYTWNLPDSARQPNASVAVELDGYDISSFISVSGDQLIVSLDTPLSPGEHHFIVLAFLANGNIETVLEDTVMIARSDATQWQVNATFDTHYRAGMKEKPEYQSVPHLGGTGGIDASNQTTNGNWQFDSRAQAMYDSVSENNTDNDEWSLANYRVAATYQGKQLQAGIAAGHILVERNDLLFSAFERRGVAASVAGNSDYQLQVFGLNSDPTTRYDGDYLVPEDASEKSVGATGSMALAGEQLIVSAGYIDGEGTLGGAGLNVEGEPTIYGGQSWNVALDSWWLNRSLWLHGEYAESEFDLDGIGVGEDEDTDSASQAIMKLSSDGDLGTAAFDYWSLLFHYQTVGARFYSMGNLFLPGDVTLHRAFTQASINGVAIDMEWAEEETNTDDDPLLATQTIERHILNLNYTPMAINPDALAWRMLGMPSAYANYQRTTNRQPDSDATIVGYDLNNETQVMTLGFQFGKERLNWGLMHQITWYDDRSQSLVESGYVIYEPYSDTRNDLTELQISWTPHERATLNVYLQWNELDEEDAGNTYNNDNFGIDGTFQLIPETLNLTMNYNLTRDRSDFSDNSFLDDDFTADVGNFQLNWSALKAHRLTPGIDFYLRGTYGKQHNHTLSSEGETWAAHVGLLIQWEAGGQP